MFLAILTMITALCISAVAIYYSIAGLVAIFAAAAIPIMIMGGVLEVGKLVTAVWLHRYWKQATWWLRTYLATSVVVLMLITSMGIFGFLSKAHIEQTSASEESIAKVEQIEKEVGRLNGIIERAENKITQLESSGSGADANIQSQIDKEQDRIDKAFDRIAPAIEQQNKIIADARETDNSRTKPYEDQLTNIQNEITRLETTAREYEDKIANLSADTSAVQPLLEQIKKIEEEIIRVTNQLQSTEKSQIRAGQAIIGVTSDGLFGGNTRTALAKWVAAQQDRISQIQGDISKLRTDATTTVDAERERLAGVVKDIRENQIPALKERELVMLGKIDEVRQTESPVIQTARDEIQRLRKSAEDQVVNSQALIERLRSQLAQTDKADEIDAAVDEQNARIKSASTEIDTLTQEKYALEAEYRKLEAEVGPIKYIAEFIYGEEANRNLLEEAVRWVIITIIFVFDPLAVLLLIASQYTFEWARRNKPFDWKSYEQARAQKIVENANQKTTQENEQTEEEVNETIIDTSSTEHNTTETTGPDAEEERDITEKELDRFIGEEEQEVSKEEVTEPVTVQEAFESEEAKEVAEKEYADTKNKIFYAGEADQTKKKELARKEQYEQLEASDAMKDAKYRWKLDHPEETLKGYKTLYIKGVIDKLPWEDYRKNEEEGYKQNAEQDEKSIWKDIKR